MALKTKPFVKRAWDDGATAFCYLTWVDERGGNHGETIQLPLQLLVFANQGMRVVFLAMLTRELHRVGAL